MMNYETRTLMKWTIFELDFYDEKMMRMKNGMNCISIRNGDDVVKSIDESETHVFDDDDDGMNDC
jgi:hypothetical protein